MKKIYRSIKKLFKGSIYLETQRLLIRYVEDSDWKDMLKLFTDFSKSPYVYYDREKPTDEAGARYRTQRYADSRIFYAVSLKDSDEVFAYVCLHDDGASHDIGYCFRSDYHGKGYAYEAVSALINYYAESFGVTAFTAGTAINNTPSVKLLHRLGFELKSTETITFFDGHPFKGGNFLLKIDK